MKHLILGINIALALFTVTVSYSAKANPNWNDFGIATTEQIDILSSAVLAVHTDSVTTDYAIESKLDSTIDFVKQQQAYIESEFSLINSQLANTTAIAGLTDDHISVAVGGHYGYTSIAIGSAYQVGNFTFKLSGAYNKDTEAYTGTAGIGYSF